MTNNNFLEMLKKRCREHPLSEKRCLRPTLDKLIVLKDEDSAEIHITVDQEEKIYKIKLDGCFFKPKTKHKRCDWILYLGDCQKIFFIELKSNDAGDCDKQFDSSVKHFENEEISYCILVFKTKKDQKIIAKMKDRKLKFKSLSVHGQKKSTPKRLTLTELLDFPQIS